MHTDSNMSLCLLRLTLRRMWIWPADQVSLDFRTASTLVADSPVISMSTWRVACFVGAKKGEIVSIGHVMNICCLQSATLSSNQAHFIRYQLASDS